ncbi:hypothetical protein F183_A04400 [Bryobacterales bacterium F-183]|nr:hypothetical protein F183_A04400 [Bryobacterales bacterium F-183]
MTSATSPLLLPAILERYSTRSYTPQNVSKEQIERIFNAAHLAASTMNEQPWRFIVAARDLDPEGHTRIGSTLVPGNAWALAAPVLGISVAGKNFARNGKPNPYHKHDTGAAMALAALQAVAEGLNLHQMGGFDAAKAAEVLEIPEGYEPVAAFALGYSDAPEPPVRQRKAMPEVLFGGKFGVAL